APIIPNTAKKVQELINIKVNIGDKSEIGKNYWAESIKFDLPSGHQTNLPSILFPRVEDEFVEREFSKLGNKNKVENVEKIEGVLDFNDFMKVKLRTAKIIEAENIKKSDKLLKLQVDLGSEKRQIIAGIAKYYKPEELIGKIIVVVANLKPAKLMGQLSEGM